MNFIDIIRELVEKFDGRIYFGYSGRGMYGKKCVGIVCDYPGDVEDHCEQIGFDKPLIDNMGLDYIAYWPNINFEKEEYDMEESMELNEVEDVVEEQEEQEEVDFIEEQKEVVEEQEEEQEEVAEEQEEQEEVAVSLTEKQTILINVFKSNVDRSWVAADLANETTELTKKQISGVLASMKKKGVIVKGDDGWTITSLGRSC